MDYDYDVTTLAPAREARQAMRRERLAEQREDERLQQLLDDAGELVEGADDRDLGDFNPNRYDRERDFDPNRYDRERDFDRERDYE
jgi:hypothetical protein